MIPQYRPNPFRPIPKPETKPKTKKKYTYKPKPTGELPLFKKIWQERGPYSQVSGEFLGEFSVAYFAHILPKAKNKYPLFKLNPQNIILMTLHEHHTFDNLPHKCTHKNWDKIHQLKISLLKQYSSLISK